LHGRLIALIALAGSIIPVSGAFGATANRPAASPGTVGIRLVSLPGTTPNDLLARSYVVDRLAPGTTLARNVEIDNNTRGNVEVSVYPAAASISRGTFVLAPGHSENELSRWTSVSERVLLLAPGTKTFDTLTISVPASASSGEHYAVLWAEVSSSSAAAGGVTLVNRVGIRIYLSIGPGGRPASNFAIGPLTAERSTTGRSLVVATVHNSGQSALDVSGDLTLTKGPGGLSAGPFAATLGGVLAPGVSDRMAVELDSGLPRGPWRAHLGLTSGLIQRSADATITFPSSANGVKSPIAVGFPTLILVVIVLLILLAVATLGLLVYRRRTLRMRPRS
jgi:hypothetical protein